MRMQQQPPRRKPSKALQRTFGWIAIAAYVLAVIAAVPPPHTSLRVTQEPLPPAWCRRPPTR